MQSDSGLPPKTYSGVKFALVGFNPIHGNSVCHLSLALYFQS